MNISRELVLAVLSEKISEIQKQVAEEQDFEKYMKLMFAWGVLIELESKVYVQMTREIA